MCNSFIWYCRIKVYMVIYKKTVCGGKKVGRASVKECKNIYQKCREECAMTRLQASEATEWISDSRIEKIESGKTTANPEEILAMAKAYKKPELCNYYCSHECAIGKKYVPEVKAKSIEKIVLEMLAALNSIEKNKDRLIEITSDGCIHDDEIKDFIAISKKLEQISRSADSLRLWLDKTIANGEINREILNKVLDEE